MSRLTAIDICAGCGGWACAARGLPIEVVAAIDFSADCLATYKHNFPDVETICANVREVDFGRFRGVDLVVGGIPCEAVSSARSNCPAKADVISDWHEIIDACLGAVKTIAPRWWCLEDVVQLIRHLPPLTPYRVIDAQLYSAQRRKRVYVGRFPAPEVPDPPNRQVLADHLRPGPYRVNAITLEREPATRSTYNRQQFYQWSPGLKSPTVCGLGSRHDNAVAIVDGSLRRQPEWQELATLQGFPPDFVFVGSPTRVAKIVGQAIQIDTGRAILKAIVREAGL